MGIVDLSAVREMKAERVVPVSYISHVGFDGKVRVEPYFDYDDDGDVIDYGFDVEPRDPTAAEFAGLLIDRNQRGFIPAIRNMFSEIARDCDELEHGVIRRGVLFQSRQVERKMPRSECAVGYPNQFFRISCRIATYGCRENVFVIVAARQAGQSTRHPTG